MVAINIQQIHNNTNIQQTHKLITNSIKTIGKGQMSYQKSCNNFCTLTDEELVTEYSEHNILCYCFILFH